jgi:hypothetical protein
MIRCQPSSQYRQQNCPKCRVVHQNIQFVVACHRVGDQIDPLRLARDVDLRSCRVPAAGPDVGGSDRPERAEYR